MAQPVWQTPPGSLSTIPQGVFYSIPLVASATGGVVTYQVIAGSLPAGLRINQDGVLSGIANSVSTFQGVAARTEFDQTSRFTVRAFSGTSLADRTFTVTVSPQNTPRFITPAGRVATYIDGDQIFDLQIETYNPDVYADSAILLVAGILPPGLTITTAGIISGVILPNITPGGTPGFSVNGQGFDQYPFDFGATSASVNYQFTLELTNGVASVLRTFSIFVYSRNSMTADNTQITADNTYITADTINQRSPVILTPAGSLGSVRSDNFFAFRFIGEDLDGDLFQFTIKPGDSAPPGLTLDPNSGWLYGYIPASGISISTYSFGIKVYKTNDPDIASSDYAYQLTITGSINADTVWLVPDFLGTIINGATSTFYVAARNKSGLPLTYQLLSGSDSQLPQGLQLRPSGHIVGRTSFITFALDNGATTFDRRANPYDNPNSVSTTGVGTETTFDMTKTFTVKATSVNGLVSDSHTFSIRIIRAFDEPYNNLYIQAMPPQDDRALLNSLLQNSNIFPPALIYRNDDPNFGVAQRVIYQHAYGLTATVLDDYVAAMNLNHYWKNLTLGQIKTAQALDDAGNVIYEVVYSEVVDNLVNNSGTSVDKIVDLPYAVDANGSIIQQVYPNSLVNMRTQMIDQIGQVGNVLPRWMLSKQINGRVLGYTPSWVIAYTIPGQSGQIAYNITSQFGRRLNLVDFKADRYELDNLLTYNWNPYVPNLNLTSITGNGYVATASYSGVSEPPFVIGQQVVIANAVPSIYNGNHFVTSCSNTQITFTSTANGSATGGTVSKLPNWIPTPPISATFDINTHYQATSFVGGTGYEIGSVIQVLGTQVGGVSPNNDILIYVNQVSPSGAIQGYFLSGVSPYNSAGQTWNNIFGTTIVGTGSSARFSFESVPGVATTFDYGSVQFTAPATLFNDGTTDYNKYLLFPKYNIVDPLPQNNTVLWYNTYGDFISWVNDTGNAVGWINVNT